MAGTVLSWPEKVNESRRMQFCRGEPRWYIWVKSCEQQPLLTLRRDLLLLHQNGDLRQLKGNMLPPLGAYITALHEGRMIRGIVLPPDARMGSETESHAKLKLSTILVLDVDDGSSYRVPLNQIRQLPDDMMRLPAQAVRCDLGLDCLEQFDWPLELNNMIQRALGNAVLYVKNTRSKPGSIPTISAEITVFFPSSGSTADLQEWLVREFSQHLKICGLVSFRPFVIGTLPDLPIPIPMQQPVLNTFNSGIPYTLQLDMMHLLQQQLCGLNVQPPPPTFWCPEMGLSKAILPFQGNIHSVPPGFVSLDPCLYIPPQNFGMQSVPMGNDLQSSESIPSSSQSSTSSVTINLPVKSLGSEESQESSTAQESEMMSAGKTKPVSPAPPPISSSLNVENVRLEEISRDWEIGAVVPAFVAHCYDPQSFEVTVVDEHCALLEEMKIEMCEFYTHSFERFASKHEAKKICADYCAFYDKAEKIWLRAEVLEWGMEEKASILVWCVDYGGTASVNLEQVQALKTPLASNAPRLTTLCTMKNVCPRGGTTTWPQKHKQRFVDLMPMEKMIYLRIDGPRCDDGWPVSVYLDEHCSLESINEILVAEQCALYVRPPENGTSVQAGCSNYDDNPMEEAYRIGGNNYDLDDEDACVAVSGRRPKDEEGICWAYQRAGGYCYKKMCTQKHILLHPDGTTQDKEEAFIDSFADLNVPEPGKTITITVSRIITVHHFIAQIRIGSGSSVLRGRESLASVLKHLNSTEGKRSLKTFTVYPADGEVVLAKNRSGMFFRGRVIDMDPEDDNKVFNVDDGSNLTVKLEDLRVADPAYLHHPFQAIECWLANHVPFSDDKEWVKTCNVIFADIVRGKQLTAKIIRSSTLGIEVQLFDTNGQDIAHTLKAEGMLKETPIQHLPSLESTFLPGYSGRKEYP